MLEDQKKIMTEVWEEELRRIEAEKATLKDQVHMHGRAKVVLVGRAIL